MVQRVAVRLEFEAWLCHATTGKLCQPSSKRLTFSNEGKIRERKERDGLRFSLTLPKTP